MRTDTPKTIYLKDYKPYPFKIHSVDLNFDIYDGYTIVTATSEFECLNSAAKDLFLNGEHLELLSVAIDGEDVTDYDVTDTALRVPCPGDRFTLEIQTKIKPEENTRLEGLYNSGGTYCTQCEAEGFRTITYYPDRPDVLSVFTVRVEADTAYPVLLSNGNKQDSGDLGNGRHFTAWHDPFPKPCYLFALVAGDLTHVHDTFTTRSGRDVDLYIYVRPGDEGQCGHAMESLKKSMAWDEETYGLEYELDLFNIVAVSDFNMGAMENTSLNIFNTALVLAQQDTATDQDFIRVESVIAHEYFHNWSGNRVTCRDWFQLSLKEGLTVFRDQEFSADMNSRGVQRIDDVSHLRRHQFPEDAGPLAHPIRPDNYIEINNFYTMTVYEKGAEVIRMMRTILGHENYRKGTDLYFSRHDGEAVTCDDFVDCMQEASGIDLSQFRLWYSQAGTPEVTFKGEYDERTQTYSVELKQSIPDTPNQNHKKPMYIPVSLGLLDSDGADLIDEQVLAFTQDTQKFTFDNISERPTPSALRGFSAPVKLETGLSHSDLAFLVQYDSDSFNRWEAAQELYLNSLNAMIDGDHKTVPDDVLSVYTSLLGEALEPDSDKAFMARIISLPDVTRIGLTRDSVDPQAIYDKRSLMLDTFVDNFGDTLLKLYETNVSSGGFSITPEAMGRRILCNTALHILSNQLMESDAERTQAHYDQANTMTDRMAALNLACALDGGIHDAVLDDFYNRFKDYPLVVDKWFGAQAQTPLPKVINKIKNLREHADFNIKNPNRVRSLYSAFAIMNPVQFHAADGAGYHFLTDGILELNAINPQIAARLLTPMRDWKRYTPDRQDTIKACLQKIVDHKDLSPDVYEIASKSLAA